MLLQFRRSICLTLFLSFSFPPAMLLCETATTVNQFDESELKAPVISIEDAEQLNQLYATWCSQTNELTSSIQHLSQLIATKKISPSDINAAFEWLQKMSMLIGRLNNIPYAPLSATKLVHLFNFNKTLIIATKDAFKSNLNNRADVELLNKAVSTLEKTIQKRSGTQLPIPAAAAYAFETEKLIKGLSIRVSHGGLSWLNRSYRKLSKLNNNLQITSTVLTATVSAIVATTLIAMIPKSFFYNDELAKDPNNLNLLQRAKYNIHTKFGEINPEAPRERSYINMFNAIGMGVTGVAAANNMFGISDKVSRWGGSLDAWMRGTTPEMRRDLAYINDITLADTMFDCIRDLFEPFNNILSFLENPDKYINTGMKVPKCILLAGPPGNGKSLSARGLAGSINKQFMEQGRFEQFGFITVEPWNFDLEDVITRAKEHAPCVIFIDELHLFGGGAQITSGNSVGLSKLLTELDKIEQSNDPAKQVLVIGATNRPDLIDPALIRDLRFKVIHFPIPSFKQRVTVLESLCKKSAVDTTTIDLEHFASLTWGASFSTLSAIFSHAGFLAKQHAEGITSNYLYQAVNTVFRKLKSTIDITQAEIDLLAFHYAGVALAYIELESDIELEAITILPHARDIVEQHEFLRQMENQSANDQHNAEYGSYYTWTENEYIKAIATDPKVECKLILGGVVAQQVMSGKKTSYKQEDYKAAFEKAKMLLLNGLAMDDLSKKDQNRIKSEALQMIVSCEAELTELFTTNKNKLNTIADLLKEKQFLTIDQINEIL